MRRYIKSNGKWVYLYRAVDKEDNTIDFLLKAKRDEFDLIILENGKMHGFEFKYSLKPTLTKSLHHVLEDLILTTMTIIVPGSEEYLIHEKVKVCGLTKSFQAERAQQTAVFRAQR